MIALYGPKLGVRTPPKARRYSEADRQAELLQARKEGIVAGGVVRWVSL